MTADFGYEVQRLPSQVLDALDDSSRHLSRTVSWSTYRTMRLHRPALVHSDGRLTRYGERVQSWLHDNRWTPSHHACAGCGAR